MWSLKTLSFFHGKKKMTFPTSFKLTVPHLKVNAHQVRLIPRDYTTQSHETSVLFGSLWRFILIFKINSVKVFLRKSERSQRELQSRHWIEKIVVMMPEIYGAHRIQVNSPDCDAERAKKTNKQTTTKKMYQAENLCQRIILLQDFLKSPYDHRNAKRHLR